MRRLGLILRAAAPARWAAVRLGAAYMWLVWRTVRWREGGRPTIDRLLATGSGLVVVIWHEGLMMTAVNKPHDRRVMAMISASRDGSVIAGVVDRFGVETARGSTYDRAKARDKGGAQALATALAAVREGVIVVMTPDGPRGPRRRAHAGAVQLALMARVPLVTLAIATRPTWRLSSWDRFRVALPFGRGRLEWDEVTVPPDAEPGDPAAVEAIRARMEALLSETTDRADAALGLAVPAGTERASAP
ncbi:MAG: lysophospholipid acyltransferase family protein [Pseudomonadota bacterium]